jgi:hypothetical protein
VSPLCADAVIVPSDGRRVVVLSCHCLFHRVGRFSSCRVVVAPAGRRGTASVSPGCRDGPRTGQERPGLLHGRGSTSLVPVTRPSWSALRVLSPSVCDRRSPRGSTRATARTLSRTYDWARGRTRTCSGPTRSCTCVTARVCHPVVRDCESVPTRRSCTCVTARVCHPVVVA